MHDKTFLENDGQVNDASTIIQLMNFPNKLPMLEEGSRSKHLNGFFPCFLPIKHSGNGSSHHPLPSHLCAPLHTLQCVRSQVKYSDIRRFSQDADDCGFVATSTAPSAPTPSKSQRVIINIYIHQLKHFLTWMYLGRTAEMGL